jgi:hypothetical protein
MENKKYQIFVSSTYEDLIKAREKVIETILSLYHFPVGMEMFSADDSEQWDIIKDTIEVSDYYVVIIGHRYGSMTSDGIGYTEKEYDYAKEKGIPILAFIRDRDIPTTPSERETNPKANEKLMTFIRKVSSNKMCDYWGTIETLITKVAIALPKTFSRKPQIGWVRGNTAVSKEISEELVKLSQENRQLRERVSELEAEIKKDKPNIEVLINSSSRLTIYIPLIIPELIEKLPPSLTISDIPDHLKEYIVDSEIDNYNKRIPSDDIINKFNKEKRLYWLSRNATPIKFSAINNGSFKANDINIVIKFPNNVAVLSVGDVKKIEDPSSPLPLSPIEIAEQKFQNETKIQEKQKKELFPFFDPFHSRSLGTVLVQPHFKDLQYLTRNINHPNITRWIKIKNNTVLIKIQNLLHTQGYEFDDDIVLIPLTEGISQAEVSIICEEFHEKKIMQLEFQVCINEN